MLDAEKIQSYINSMLDIRLIDKLGLFEIEKCLR